MSTDKLAAVIVTYNRSDKLHNVIAALQAQTRVPDEIFVIDNASTDDTAEVVRQMAQDLPQLSHVRLAKNMGGAGGFHEGIKTAYAAGADHIWVSDDDAYPEPDAIAHLLAALPAFEAETGWRPSFACSRVEWTDGSICEMNIPLPVWDWARFLTRQTPRALVLSCSFVSVLIPRWAVEKHGLPIAEYFIWYDDAEYTRRLAGSYPGLFIPDSRVIHDLAENKGVNYSLINDKNLWKFVYGARNELSFRRREGGLPSALAFAYKVRGEMRRGHVARAHRWKIYGALWRGWRFRPQIKHV